MDQRPQEKSHPGAPLRIAQTYTLEHSLIDMLSQNQLSRMQILSSLKGASAVIPNIQALLGGWPHRLNPEIERLHEEVDKYLETLFPPGKRLRKMKALNAAHFASSWWPYASYEALRTLTYLSIWLFAWDDETDSLHFSSLAADLPRAHLFRLETIDYIRECLTDENGASHNPCSNSVITCFRPVGKAVRESCTDDQLRSFLDELEYFVVMTEVEQFCSLRDNLPSVDEYLQRRKGSSAVGVCLALTEYAFDMELPPSVMRNVDMRQLWDETNVIISTTNDILSVKKEVEQGQIDSLIPILYVREGSLQGAFEVAMSILEASVKAFSQCSQRLLARYAHDQQVHRALQKFITGCQYACTANLNWSLESSRYKLRFKSLNDNVMMVL